MTGEPGTGTEEDAPAGVFLVDDHKVVRTGLAAYLATEPGLRVVGEAADGKQALSELAVLDGAGRLPHVVLMDLQMPTMDGVTATAEIKRRWPEVEVVAVTSFMEEARVRAALEAGATGYLLKDAGADEVASAIRSAVAGEVHLDPAVARALTAALRAPRSAVESLTARERDVVVLLATGGTNRQIGRLLGVAERTARTHVSNILAKLGLASRTQAAMWAVKEGLVPRAAGPGTARDQGSAGVAAQHLHAHRADRRADAGQRGVAGCPAARAVLRPGAHGYRGVRYRSAPSAVQQDLDRLLRALFRGRS